jgi:methyl-accepting chemotaxis protein
MNWFFSPAIRLFSGTRVSNNLYWIGGLSMMSLMLLITLSVNSSATWLSADLRRQMVMSATACLFASTYMLGGLFLRIGPDVTKLAQAIKRIGSGDLTGRIDEAQTFEGSRLSDYAAQTTRNLIAIVTQVRASADTVLSGARELAGGNEQLSHRTEAQASTLEQTAASLEELAATARQNADRCRRSNELSAQTRSTATASAAQVSDLVESMGAIVASSEKIGEIVAVIEGIAFQTNILALNAAVEAARAGDQGRGFAVVASEVRELAQRSSNAAKEIKTLIQESVDRVQGGTQQVSIVAATIREVVSGVAQVNDVIAEIAIASQEQRLSIDEINGGIAQLEQTSLHNTALVEEASAVTMGFEGEAQRLSAVVDKFKIDHVASREQAVSLVQNAAQLLKAMGVESAFAEFEKPNGAYLFGEYYVFVFDFNGTMRIHPTLKGQNIMTLTDDNGKQFMRAMIEAAKIQANGWEDYLRLNPVTQRIEPKSAYYQRVGDMILACGIYKTEVQHAPSPLLQPLRLVANNKANEARFSVRVN